jgi:hypothetical protein
VIGTHDLFEHPHINDLAYMPAEKDGKFGFNLLVGGFISPKRWGEALPLDAWVPGDDIIPVCKAVLEAYRDLGTRGNRQKTRMMWLIDELVSFQPHEYNLASRTILDDAKLCSVSEFEQCRGWRCSGRRSRRGCRTGCWSARRRRT